MSIEEKIALLEETLGVDEGTISPETNLDDIEEYDSMTKLGIIVMMDDEFGVKLTAEIIKSFSTVDDILKIMEKA